MMPVAFVAASVYVLAAIDLDQVGQAVIGAFIVAGFLVTQYKNHKRAREVEELAREEATKVAKLAKEEADIVREKVDATRTRTEQQLQDIHIMVDGRLDQALRTMHELREEIDVLKGDAPGTSQSEAGPDVLKPEHKP